MRGAVRIVACVFAVYALVETVFAIYYYHLVRRAKVQPPPTGLPPIDRNALFQKVLSLETSVSATIPQPSISTVPAGSKSRQGKSVLGELQIKIHNARNENRSLPSMGEIVMTATEDSMTRPNEATAKAGFGQQSAGIASTDGSRAVELRGRLRPW
jgi:hypothetical protein